MGFTNPVTAVRAVGGTVDSVTGSVGSVQDPVTPDPASSIAVVSSAVPFTFRDTFFWPALSGEQFPPARSSSVAYGTSLAWPAYLISSSTSAGAGVTFPALPRIGYNGKTTMVGQAVLWITARGGATGVADAHFGFGNNVSSQRHAAFEFVADTHTSGYNVTATVSDGTTQTVSGPLTTIALNSPHTFAVALNADGTVWFSLDGQVVWTAPATWAPNITDTTPQLALVDDIASGPSLALAAPSVSWS